MTTAPLALCERPPRSEPGAPWPIVDECHSSHLPGHSCPQIDWSHEHQWVAWHGAPRTDSTAGTSVVDQSSGPGIPVRCTVCGGRKCDMPSCLLRRHHGGDHEHY